MMNTKSVIQNSIILASCLFIAGTSAFSSDLMPAWRIGSWWEYSTTMDVHLEDSESDDYVDMIITDLDTRHNLASIEVKTLTHGTPPVYEAYIVPFSGVVNADGVYHMDGSNIPIQVRNADLSGEWWVHTETLDTVYYYREIQGPLWAQIPVFGWQEIGTVEMILNEEYEPGREAVRFPVSVGDSWQANFTVYTFGEYVIDAELFGEPIYRDETFDDSSEQSIDMHVPVQEIFNGLLAYRIEGEDTGSDGTVLVYYAPEAETLVYEHMEDFNASSGMQINSYTRVLGAYYLEPSGPDCLNHGDVNGDGLITAADAQLAFLIVLGLHSPSYVEECAADCNGDGMVTAADAQQIFLTALGMSACEDAIP